MSACRAGGLRVMCDCYPYYAFSTSVGSATYDDGFLTRYETDYSAIEMCEGKYKGIRCTKESFEEMRRDYPQGLTVCHVMKPEEVDLAFSDPGVMLASDGILDNGQGRPRAAGTFPRLISEFVGADADLVIFDPERIKDCATFADPTLPPVGISRVMVDGKTAVLDGVILNDRLGGSVRK